MLDVGSRRSRWDAGGAVRRSWCPLPEQPAPENPRFGLAPRQSQTRTQQAALRISGGTWETLLRVSRRSRQKILRVPRRPREEVLRVPGRPREAVRRRRRRSTRTLRRRTSTGKTIGLASLLPPNTSTEPTLIPLHSWAHDTSAPSSPRTGSLLLLSLGLCSTVLTHKFFHRHSEKEKKIF